MPDKNKLNEDLEHFENLNAKDEQLIQKLDEFMVLLENSSINSENVKAIKTRINSALDSKISSEELVREIKEVSLSDMDKIDQLEKLEKLLNANYLDSNQLKANKFKVFLHKGIKIVIGFLFITLGFAMIIMPAPQSFEMFTIFNFTPDDGVTIMDLISLIIIATGTFIVISSILNIKTDE